MSENQSNNKQIVKNTLFLYARMILTLAVSLYTARVVLNVLGIEDYGIYNVVGGVVTMLSFMNSALSNATTRFLTFELGVGNNERLKRTFSSIIFIHLVLAIVMLLIIEAVGYWFVANKLTIPSDRLDAALFVFHFSVLACMVNIIELPFHAAIISHERMDAFAYISIFDVVMKLFIVFLLEEIKLDKLMTYSVLVFLVYGLTTFIYVFYCFRNFKECKSRPSLDKSIAKPIISFSGWDLYGNFSVVIRNQGLNILQNLFFGPIVNAATGISNQVMTAIMGFAENFLLASKPQIIKQYAEKNIESFISLINNISRYSTLLLFLISFPFFLEIDFILQLWLVEVPDFTAEFCRLSIINNWISILYRPVVTGIYATGNAKRISVINGSIYMFVLPLSYLFLKLGGSPVIPFILNILLLFIGHTFFSLKTMHIYVMQFSIFKFLKSSVLMTACIMLLSAIPTVFIYSVMDYSWNRVLFTFIISTISIMVFSYFLGVDKQDKQYIKLFLTRKFTKNNL